MFTSSSDVHQRYSEDEKEDETGKPYQSPSMMNFSFGEYLDEMMMNMYYAVIQ